MPISKKCPRRQLVYLRFWIEGLIRVFKHFIVGDCKNDRRIESLLSKADYKFCIYGSFGCFSIFYNIISTSTGKCILILYYEYVFFLKFWKFIFLSIRLDKFKCFQNNGGGWPQTALEINVYLHLSSISNTFFPQNIVRNLPSPEHLSKERW